MWPTLRLACRACETLSCEKRVFAWHPHPVTCGLDWEFVRVDNGDTTMPRNILILRHVPREPAGTLETILTDAGLVYQYVDLFEEVPRDLPLIHSVGLVVLGGPMNVDDVEQYPFLAREVGWIQAAMDQHLPVLGVCLGAQLLAKALGSRVYPNAQKEIGWHPIELTPRAVEDPLFSADGVQTVFQWHGDTFDLPQGAVHLARSPLCANQAFRFGSRAWGLQFHIEMTAAMVEDWLNEAERSGELAEANVDPQEVRRQTPMELPGLQAMANRVLGRFAELCPHF
jgi:GMP synthase (glutamine-hydrolysing)